MARARVCVSGVTGYIASHVVKDLLEAGYFVHGTARQLSDPSRIAHITALPNAGAHFRAFEADLTTPGSFDAALLGCDYAIHCASPFVLDGGADPQKTLVDPAVNGTVCFLDSCRNAGTVKKVVVTSSIAAVADEGGYGAVFDESVWNEKSSLKRLPYYYSKVKAEKAAWEWAEKNPQIKIVAINPFLVIGPSLVKALNPSPETIKSIIESKDFPGIVDVTFTFVDVRDVSKAHIAAIERDSASGRYICANSEKPLHMREVVALVGKMGFTPSTLNLTSPIVTKLIKLSSYISPGGWLGCYVRNHFGNPILLTNEKIKRDLGVVFRDPEVSIRDTVQDMIKWGHLVPPTGPPAS